MTAMLSQKVERLGRPSKRFLGPLVRGEEQAHTLLLACCYQEGLTRRPLVDDDESLRRLARYILSDHGYHVIEASDGAEALKIASAHPGSIDLLLTDVIMPKLDGIVLADRILQHRPGMAVLFTSEYVESALYALAILM
jgi:ActR/RegA family two-component response regulator